MFKSISHSLTMLAALSLAACNSQPEKQEAIEAPADEFTDEEIAAAAGEAASDPVETEQAPRALTGEDVAFVYSKYYFCYNHDVSSNSCSAFETGNQTGNIITIFNVQSSTVDYEANSISELFVKEAFRDTSFLPGGFRMVDTQTMSVTETGLCRSRSRYVDDALKAEMILLDDMKKAYPEETDLSGEKLRELRSAVYEEREGRLKGGMYCVQYTGTLSGTDIVLQEKLFVDGVAQSSLSTITLLPKTDEKPGLRPRH